MTVNGGEADGAGAIIKPSSSVMKTSMRTPNLDAKYSLFGTALS
jgi:hypothetical protein